MLIRVLQDSDVELVSQLDDMSNWNAHKIRDCLRHSQYQCWTMELDGQLIGYAISQVIIDEGHIMNIAIHSGYRGQGYGEQLLQHVIATLDVEKILLEVRTDNIAAKALYKKLGFKKISERKGYYHVDGKTFDADMYSLLPLRGEGVRRTDEG